MKPSTYKLICGFTNRHINILHTETGYQRALTPFLRQSAARHYREMRKRNTRQKFSEYIQSARTPVDL